MSVSRAVGAQIPSLRRFARALTGSQRSGDAYVTETLESLVADPSLIPSEAVAKAALYRLFLTMWNSVEVNQEASPPATLTGFDRNLQTISPAPRQAFLLTALEGFSLEDAAQIMLISEKECRRLIEQAGREIADTLFRK